MIHYNIPSHIDWFHFYIFGWWILMFQKPLYMWVLKSKQTILVVACSASLPLLVPWKPWEVLVVLRDIQTFHTRYPTKKKSFLRLLQFIWPFLLSFPSAFGGRSWTPATPNKPQLSIAPSDPHYQGVLNVMLVIWFSLLRMVVWISCYWLSYKPNSSK